MAALARVEVADGQAKAKRQSRTPIDDSSWNLKPRRRRPPYRAGQTAARRGRQLRRAGGADTDRTRIIRHKRSTLLQHGERIRSATRVYVRRHYGGRESRALPQRLGMARRGNRSTIRRRGLEAATRDGRHLLRVVHGRGTAIVHFHAIATAEVAREMAALDPEALDSFCWFMPARQHQSFTLETRHGCRPLHTETHCRHETVRPRRPPR